MHAGAWYLCNGRSVTSRIVYYIYEAYTYINLQQIVTSLYNTEHWSVVSSGLCLQRSELMNRSNNSIIMILCMEGISHVSGASHLSTSISLCVLFWYCSECWINKQEWSSFVLIIICGYCTDHMTSIYKT